MSFIATSVYQSLFVILNYVIWNKGIFLNALPQIFLESFYNGLITLIFYYIIKKKTETIIK